MIHDSIDDSYNIFLLISDQNALNFCIVFNFSIALQLLHKPGLRDTDVDIALAGKYSSHSNSFVQCPLLPILTLFATAYLTISRNKGVSIPQIPQNLNFICSLY